jgi:hypothetical protein
VYRVSKGRSLNRISKAVRAACGPRAAISTLPLNRNVFEGIVDHVGGDWLGGLGGAESVCQETDD